jgi:hypothetical protein
MSIASWEAEVPFNGIEFINDIIGALNRFNLLNNLHLKGAGSLVKETFVVYCI